MFMIFLGMYWLIWAWNRHKIKYMFLRDVLLVGFRGSCFYLITNYFLCSATMDIHCVLPVKRGYRTDALLVDKSLEILGVWPWRRWLSHLNCPASITPWDAQKYFHTTVSLNMRQCATSDHITVRMLDQSVLLSGISHSWLPIWGMITRWTCTQDAHSTIATWSLIPGK